MMKFDVKNLLGYIFVGGLAVLSQYASDKQTERLATKAAAHAVVNVLSEAGLIEEKPPDTPPSSNP